MLERRDQSKSTLSILIESACESHTITVNGPRLSSIYSGIEEQIKGWLSNSKRRISGQRMRQIVEKYLVSDFFGYEIAHHTRYA